MDGMDIPLKINLIWHKAKLEEMKMEDCLLLIK